MKLLVDTTLEKEEKIKLLSFTKHLVDKTGAYPVVKTLLSPQFITLKEA